MPLQQDHSHTRSHGAHNVEAETEDAKAELRNRKTRSSTLGAGRVSRPRSSRGLGSTTDNTGALDTSSLEHSTAARCRRSSDSSLGSSLALEATAVGDSLGVGIEGKRQLILCLTHAVSTIRTGGRVLVDALAVLSLLLTADEAEHVTIVLLGNVVCNNTAEGFDHAGAEWGVGSRGKRVRGSLPFAGGNLGASSSGGVGWVVVGHLDTAGSGLGNLLGQVLVVLVGGDLAARNGRKT
jgi:hypothetical protein